MSKKLTKPRHTPRYAVYNDWLASRKPSNPQGTSYIVPGAQRPWTVENARIAWSICNHCAVELLSALWSIQPLRTSVMLLANIVRGLFPAFRGYSQAMIINEVQSLVASGGFTWSRLLRVIATEGSRRIFESLVDSYASSNEDLVYSSLRFHVEFQQMEQRVRLDIPTLHDPVVRDLLQESDLFVSSLSGSGGFGLLSPFDFVHIFALLSELISHIWILIALIGNGGSAQIVTLMFAIFFSVLPLLLSWWGIRLEHYEDATDGQHARAARRQEKMRHLAYSDTHRPEVIIFGLGPWILESWSKARQTRVKAELSAATHHPTLTFAFSQFNVSDILFALQNIPLILIMQSSSASLGSLALYRSSIQALVFVTGRLLTTFKLAFQSIFLMSAFCAATTIQPRLQPPRDKAVGFSRIPRGIKLSLKDVSYTYPGSQEPSIKNINLEVNPGETIAIVGYNGSGKSTLAKVLLRIIDFDIGDLHVNDIDVRRFSPSEYHRHVTTVFQSFSKFDSTVKENIGIGQVLKLTNEAVEEAMRLAGAGAIVQSLPNGLQTKLDGSGGFQSFTCQFPGEHDDEKYNKNPHGLSGGEWQRIAIARAFMRVGSDIDLLLLDEPTSALDAISQRQVFDSIDHIVRDDKGKKCKTVIFITHRLSTARRADKIAMMERGTITEFGSHEELLRRNGSYARLYRASE